VVVATGAALMQARAVVPSSTAAPAAAATAPVVYQPLADHKPVIYLIGDSTVKNGQDNGSNGQWGWGHILHYYFDEAKVSVENDAVGGTSTRTFMQSANMWGRVAAKLQQGDYVIMQFGHNDNTMPPATDTLRFRSTINGNGEETVQGPKDANTMETIHSFGWYIRQYISQAHDKKANAIVCSLIPRNGWNGAKMNRADNGYALWSRQAADQGGAFFVPLNALIADKCDALGKDKVTAELFPPGETTHTNWAGAKLNAGCVVEGLKALQDSPLKDFLKASPVVPETADVQAGAGRGAGGPGGARGGRGPASAPIPGR
jgi:lysophospholipase L1-like esterase